MIASIIFFGLHVLGLIWTENIIWGLKITHKMWYFLLLFPVLHSIVNKDYIMNLKKSNKDNYTANDLTELSINYEQINYAS